MNDLTQTPNDKLLLKLSELYEMPINDLSMIMPRAYDVSAQETSIEALRTMPDKSKVMLRGTLLNFRVKKSGKITFIYADLNDEHGNKQICQWASSSALAHSKMVALQSESNGKRLQLIATITSFEGNTGRVVFLSNAKFDEVKQLDSNTIMPNPTYMLKGTVKAFELKRAIAMMIGSANISKYTMGSEIEKKLGLCNLQTALEHVHGLHAVASENLSEFVEFSSEYHKRIRMEKIYRILARLSNDKTVGKCPLIHYSKDGMRKLASFLPFELTIDQKKALGCIFNVFSSGVFKSMLLQGDVGSGKTAVSIFASATVSQSQHQVAVLAPSAVLAKQLYDEYYTLLQPLGIEVYLLSGKTTKKQRDSLQKKIDKDPGAVVVGTTAVNNLEFNNLGLVIVDEEQKFGVEAKRALLKDVNNLPYIIYMSATPLPRSIQSSIYGNFEVIKIAAKPSGRLEVKGKMIENYESACKLLDFIEAEAKEGRTSLIIAPSISSGELASIEKIEQICLDRFGDSFFKSIHGNLKEKEIQANIQAYRDGEFSLMIATSMVEAGFSHPNLSVVVITGPDRFGLSSLHQIRGRAGRSQGLRGYCALWPLDFKLKPKAYERLDYFCAHYDGFDLANRDLQLRGSGDLTGRAQSGGEINFVEYADEVELIKNAMA